MTITNTAARPTTTKILQRPGGRPIELGAKPLVMGVLNITPDSFSDGGLWLDPDRAVRHARAMVEAGADLLDLGAESTRPGGGVYGDGAQEVPLDEELARLVPVLEALRAELDVPLSVDTRKGNVAEQAVASGADLINDISALEDPGLARVVAATDCPIVLMHSRGILASMQTGIRFENVTREVRSELLGSVELARAAGIRDRSIVIDPGIGFGKSAKQSLALLGGLDELTASGYPVLVGASRKSFINSVSPTGPQERLAGSLAAVAWAAQAGAAIVRVHDVAETRQFLDVWHAIRHTSEEGGA